MVTLGPPLPSLPRSATQIDTAGLVASRQLSALIALTGFVLALVWVGAIGFGAQDERTTRRQALLNLTNLNRAFAEHTTKSLEGADQAVRFVRSEYLQHHEALDIPRYLTSRSIIDDDYHLLTIIGPNGYVSHSSRPFTPTDLHEREHFRIHAQGKADRLFVSKPVLGKVSGKWSIQITRRIDEADGRFGGVVVVSMAPEYFTSFYKEVDLGRHGTISLIGLDGIVRSRATRDGTSQGMDISGTPTFGRLSSESEGSFETRSSIDGVVRFYAFRRLPEHDLVVVTGIARDDAMGEFGQRHQVMLWVAAAASVLLMWFAVTLFRRIRTQRNLMCALQDSEVQAQSANRMKSNLLASVSHELRTPLNGILGYAELIRDSTDDPQAAEFGGIIHESAQHLHALVNQILDLAKLESGRMIAHVAPTPLRPLLEEAYLLHRVHAKSKGLGFEILVDADCPEKLETDRTRLTQVLSNLLNNAIKFTSSGGVSLHASSLQGRLVVSVADTGAGIPAAQVPGLFKRFQGVEDDRVQANQGAGLGLSLARELTELIGGSLTLTSTVAAGTTVRLELPLQAPSTPAPPSEKPAR